MSPSLLNNGYDPLQGEAVPKQCNGLLVCDFGRFANRKRIEANMKF